MSEVGGMDDATPNDFPTTVRSNYRQEPADSSAEAIDAVRELRSRLQGQRRYTRALRRLALVTCYAALYTVLLILQNMLMYRYGSGFQMMTALTQVLAPRDAHGEAASFLAGQREVLSYLEEQVVGSIWKDRVCGNSICEEPQEFPAVGQMGCVSDCGRERADTSLLLYIHANFTVPGHSSNDLRRRVAWNLCRQDKARSTHGLPPVCWFAKPQMFRTIFGSIIEQYDVPAGSWYIHITGDDFGAVAGRVYELSNGRQIPLPTTPEWSSCFQTVRALNNMRDEQGVLRRMLSAYYSAGSEDGKAPDEPSVSLEDLAPRIIAADEPRVVTLTAISKGKDSPALSMCEPPWLEGDNGSGVTTLWHCVFISGGGSHVSEAQKVSATCGSGDAPFASITLSCIIPDLVDFGVTTVNVESIFSRNDSWSTLRSTTDMPLYLMRPHQHVEASAAVTADTIAPRSTEDDELWQQRRKLLVGDTPSSTPTLEPFTGNNNLSVSFVAEVTLPDSCDFGECVQPLPLTALELGDFEAEIRSQANADVSPNVTVINNSVEGATLQTIVTFTAPVNAYLALRFLSSILRAESFAQASYAFPLFFNASTSSSSSYQGTITDVALLTPPYPSLTVSFEAALSGWSQDGQPLEDLIKADLQEVVMPELFDEEDITEAPTPNVTLLASGDTTKRLLIVFEFPPNTNFLALSSILNDLDDPSYIYVWFPSVIGSWEVGSWEAYVRQSDGTPPTTTPQPATTSLSTPTTTFTPEPQSTGEPTTSATATPQLMDTPTTSAVATYTQTSTETTTPFASTTQPQTTGTLSPTVSTSDPQSSPTVTTPSATATQPGLITTTLMPIANTTTTTPSSGRIFAGNNQFVVSFSANISRPGMCSSDFSECATLPLGDAELDLYRSEVATEAGVPVSVQLEAVFNSEGGALLDTVVTFVTPVDLLRSLAYVSRLYYSVILEAGFFTFPVFLDNVENYGGMLSDLEVDTPPSPSLVLRFQATHPTELASSPTDDLFVTGETAYPGHQSAAESFEATTSGSTSGEGPVLLLLDSEQETFDPAVGNSNMGQLAFTSDLLAYISAVVPSGSPPSSVTIDLQITVLYLIGETQAVSVDVEFPLGTDTTEVAVLAATLSSFESSESSTVFPSFSSGDVTITELEAFVPQGDEPTLTTESPASTTTTTTPSSIDPFDGSNAFVFVFVATVFMPRSCDEGQCQQVLPLGEDELDEYVSEIANRADGAVGLSIDVVQLTNSSEGAELATAITFIPSVDIDRAFLLLGVFYRAQTSESASYALPVFFDGAENYVGLVDGLEVLTPPTIPCVVSFDASFPLQPLAETPGISRRLLRRSLLQTEAQSAFQTNLESYLASAVSSAGSIPSPYFTIISADADETQGVYVRVQFPNGTETTEIAGVVVDLSNFDTLSSSIFTSFAPGAVVVDNVTVSLYEASSQTPAASHPTTTPTQTTPTAEPAPTQQPTSTPQSTPAPRGPFTGDNEFQVFFYATVQLPSWCYFFVDETASLSCPQAMPLDPDALETFESDVSYLAGSGTTSDVTVVINTTDGALLATIVSFQAPVVLFDALQVLAKLDNARRNGSAFYVFPTFFDGSSNYDGTISTLGVLTPPFPSLSLRIQVTLFPSTDDLQTKKRRALLQSSWEVALKSDLATYLAMAVPSATLDPPVVSVTVLSTNGAIQTVEVTIDFPDGTDTIEIATVVAALENSANHGAIFPSFSLGTILVNGITAGVTASPTPSPTLPPVVLPPIPSQVPTPIAPTPPAGLPPTTLPDLSSQPTSAAQSVPPMASGQTPAAPPAAPPSIIPQSSATQQPLAAPPDVDTSGDDDNNDNDDGENNDDGEDGGGGNGNDNGDDSDDDGENDAGNEDEESNERPPPIIRPNIPAPAEIDDDVAGPSGDGALLGEGLRPPIVGGPVVDGGLPVGAPSPIDGEGSDPPALNPPPPLPDPPRPTLPPSGQDDNEGQGGGEAPQGDTQDAVGLDEYYTVEMQELEASGISVPGFLLEGLARQVGQLPVVAEVRDYEEEEAAFNVDYQWEDGYDDEEGETGTEQEKSEEEKLRDEGVRSLIEHVTDVSDIRLEDDEEDEQGEAADGGRNLGVQLELLGPREVDVLQGTEYEDGGARATGALRSVQVGGLPVDTDSLGLHYVVYSYRDSRGRVLDSVSRRVRVAPRCPGGEFLCETGSFCSTQGDCVLELIEWGTDSRNADAYVRQYAPPPDNRKPEIRLLGDGALLQTQSGVLIMTDTVTQGTNYTDPGVFAFDSIDGDITERVTAWGASQISTQTPTAPDDPYVVQYSVTDTAGNSANVVRRRVSVQAICPPGELLCPDGTCTVEGVCLVRSLRPLAVLKNRPPKITLLGNATISILQGIRYTACFRYNTSRIDVCDPGAMAIDPEDGFLTPRILACSPPGTETFRFNNAGIRRCGIDTRQPGRYTVSFKIFDSAGLSASVQRIVIVTPRCSPGERVCASGTQCSVRGVCVADLLPSDTGLASSSTSNTPPTIQLRGEQYVAIRQHSPYYACTNVSRFGNVDDAVVQGLIPEGQREAAEAQCDPGATANSTITGADLNSRMLSCSPTNCSLTGCAGFEVEVKGVQGCLNSSAPVGSIFQIRFSVLDPAATPPISASVIRIVTVVSPCDPGFSYCSELQVCSPVPCDLYAEILEENDGLGNLASQQPGANDGLPVIELVGPELVILPYGTPLPFSLLACDSLNGTAGSACGASAVDPRNGADLSPGIRVMELNCPSGRGSGGGFCRCDASSLAVGSCLPGAYRYRYSVTNADGEAGEPAFRTVRVEQRAELVSLIEMELSLPVFVADSDIFVSSLPPSADDLQPFVEKYFTQLANASFPASNASSLTEDVGVEVVEILDMGTSSSGQYRVTVALILRAATAESQPYLSDGPPPAPSTVINPQRRRSLLRELQQSAFDGQQPTAGETSSSPIERLLVDLKSTVGEFGCRLNCSAFDLPTLINSTTTAANDSAGIDDIGVDAVRVVSSQARASTPAVSIDVSAAAALQIVLATVNDKLVGVMDAVSLLANQTSRELIAETLEEQRETVSAFQSAVEQISDMQANIQAAADTADQAAAREVQEAILQLRQVRDLIQASEEQLDVIQGLGSAFREASETFLRSQQNEFDLLIAGLSEPPVEEAEVNRRCSSAASDRVLSFTTEGGSSFALRSPTVPLIDRYVGIGNRIMGGVLVTQVRGGVSPGASFGTDPVFLPSSALYDDQVARRVADYYGASETGAQGVPPGFFPTGNNSVFHVYFDGNLDQTRATDLVLYLGDGVFLDANTREVSMQTVVYNRASAIVATGNVVFSWQPSGVITVDTEVGLVPLVNHQYGDDGAIGGLQLTVDIFLSIFVLLSIGLLIRKILRRRWSKWARVAWKDLDVLIVLLQVSAIIVFWVYVYGPAAAEVTDTIKPAYNFYDSVGFASARFLLPAKATVMLGNATDDDGGSPGMVSSSSLPGTPGRWQLPDNLTDTESYLRLHQVLATQGALLTSYHVLQAAVIFFLVFRSLNRTTPIPHLGVTMRSLRRALPELLTFMFLAFACVCCYMVLGTLAFGRRIETFASLSSSFGYLWVFQLVGGWEDAVYEILDPSVKQDTSETVLLFLYYVTVPVFFLFILFNFLLGIIMDSFSEEKELLENETLDDVLMRYTSVVRHILRRDESSAQAVVLRHLEAIATGFAAHRSPRSVSIIKVEEGVDGVTPEVQQQLQAALDAFLREHDTLEDVLKSRRILTLPVDEIKLLLMQRLEAVIRRRKDTLHSVGETVAGFDSSDDEDDEDVDAILWPLGDNSNVA